MTGQRVSAAVLSLLLAGSVQAQTGPDETAARVVVRSVPTGATILGERVLPLATTPDTLNLAADTHTLRASLQGYQPLSHTFVLAAGKLRVFEFVLESVPPEPPAPADLGLGYEQATPLLTMDRADRVRERTNSLTETFLVFPFVHGLMAMTVTDEGDSYPAEAFAIGGAVLVAGSYLIGRHLYARELTEINEANLMLEDMNREAKTHNIEVEKMIRQVHAQAVIEWQRANEGRGRVIEDTRRP